MNEEQDLDAKVSGPEEETFPEIAQGMLYALGFDFDLMSQLAAIHGLLRRNRQDSAELAEEIKEAEIRARSLTGVLNESAVDEWVERVHHSAYQDAAHSMAAVGMLAPFIETVFYHSFLGIGERLFQGSCPERPHERWKAAPAKRWDCHFFITNGKLEKGLANGIVQLLDALGLANRLPEHFEQTISALFDYRNSMFHNGFEWPLGERRRFVTRIAKECQGDWFNVGTSGGEPWIIYMSDSFVQHVFESIEQVIKVMEQFVIQSWPEGQTF